MIDKHAAERLAAAGNALRPDWPVKSIMTALLDHRDRAYRDVAVALAYIATDPDTRTPARLKESGPWWSAVATQSRGCRTTFRATRTRGRCIRVLSAGRARFRRHRICGSWLRPRSPSLRRGSERVEAVDAGAVGADAVACA